MLVAGYGFKNYAIVFLFSLGTATKSLNTSCANQCISLGWRKEMKCTMGQKGVDADFYNWKCFGTYFAFIATLCSYGFL